MLSQAPGHPLATSWVLVALAKTASHGVQTVPASSWPREIERIGDKGVWWVTLETQECMQGPQGGGSWYTWPSQVQGQEEVMTKVVRPTQPWLCQSS